MQRRTFNLKLAALATLALALLGGVLFYFVDDPFNPLFIASLVLMIGGVIATGFIASHALVRSARRWQRFAGYVSVSLLLLLSTGVVSAVIDYRLFFYHQLSKDEWRQDVQTLAAGIQQRHPNPFFKMKPEDFRREVARLEQEIPNLSDAQIEMRMVKLVALLGDGHSTTFPFQPATGFRMYPLELYHFSDGLYVTRANDEYKSLIGTRVVKLGDTAAEQAYQLLKPFVGADSEPTVLDRIPHYYLCAETLHALGLSARAEEAAFTFAADDGQERTVTLKPVGLLRYFYWYFKPLQSWKHRPALDPATPFHLRDHEWNNYWFTYLEAERTLYFQYNQVRNKSDESITEFSQRLIAFAHAHPVERTVIDLRHNSGGDNTTFKQFVEDLSRSPVINRRGHLFTLIGRHTFSAAVNRTTTLERKTQTLFVGEAAGAGPNHYGDPKFLVLPHSKLIVLLSSRYWQLGDAKDARLAHEPDIPVPVSHRDYFSNQDSVLATALQYQPSDGGGNP